MIASDWPIPSRVVPAGYSMTEFAPLATILTDCYPPPVLVETVDPNDVAVARGTLSEMHPRDRGGLAYITPMSGAGKILKRGLRKQYSKGDASC